MSDAACAVDSLHQMPTINRDDEACLSAPTVVSEVLAPELMGLLPDVATGDSAVNGAISLHLRLPAHGLDDTPQHTAYERFYDVALRRAAKLAVG